MISLGLTVKEDDFVSVLEKEVALKLEALEEEVARRRALASEEVRASTLVELRGARSGKVYRYGGGTYQASASGEAPAERSGAFLNSWVTLQEDSEKIGVESGLSVGGYLLGELLEHGTSRMGARPYKEKILERALPKVEEIFGEEYEI